MLGRFRFQVGTRCLASVNAGFMTIVNNGVIKARVSIRWSMSAAGASGPDIEKQPGPPIIELEKRGASLKTREV
jgi:hypothetical protein